MGQKKILLADDNRQLRLLVKTTLAHHDYDVIEAEDGEAAIEMAVDHRPDLVLLDVFMPKLDGFEVLKFLRKRPETASLRVVMMTAADFDPVVEPMPDHADGLVRKPFSPSELLGEVQRVLLH